MNEERNTKPEWHNLADIVVQRKEDNTLVNLALYLKIIEGEKYYKVNGEHVRLLMQEETNEGFVYNATTASYRVFI